MLIMTNLVLTLTPQGTEVLFLIGSQGKEQFLAQGHKTKQQNQD